MILDACAKSTLKFNSREFFKLHWSLECWHSDGAGESAWILVAAIAHYSNLTSNTYLNVWVPYIFIYIYIYIYTYICTYVNASESKGIHVSPNESK